jgi:hypothetical protein
MWWETANGGYVNTRYIVSLDATGGATPATITANLAPTGTVVLKDTYADGATAQDAAQKLCQGIDPTAITA